MAKKQSFSSFPTSLFKKSTLSALIALLTLAIYQLLDIQHPSITPPPAPVQLPASDQPLKLYSNQTSDDLTQLYVSAIQSAQESITLIIYALMDPTVIEALNQKTQAGIPVYIVCDAKASPGLSRKLPQATIVRRLAEGLVHQKILIIDNKQIILGSANLTTNSLRVHGNLVMAIYNPALAEALTAKAKSMDEEGNFTPLTHRETQAADQHLELWVLPDDPGAVKRMIELFRSAQKSIKVAMFTWTRNDFTEELIEAARRGVKVEAVLDRYSGAGASAKVVRLLSQAGIPVRLSTGKGLLHHKFAYIDDTILVNGSANWTNSAFKVNDDYFVVLYPLSVEQQDKMNRLWQVVQQNSEKPGLASPKKETKRREKVPVLMD